MFSHALSSKILVDVTLGEYGSQCNLHYGNDLLVLTTCSLKDVRIVKLIIFLFKGTTELETNFEKTCLFSRRLGELPEEVAAETLNCEMGLLPVTYLGVLTSGRWPRQPD